MPETANMGRTTYGVLEQARASFAERSWQDAYRQFVTADVATPLELDDLESLALAAWSTPRPPSRSAALPDA